MEEPSNLAMDENRRSRENSPAGARPPKIQVKSQNPMSTSFDPRASRAPSRSFATGNYATRSPSPVPMGNYPSRGPAPKDLPRAPAKAPSPSGAPSPSSPVRLRGGSPDVKAKHHLAANPHTFPKSPPPPRVPKSPVRSPKTPSFVAPGVVTPVFPAEPADMAGALTSIQTGLTYPWNYWGPVSKYGYLDNVTPTWVQKRHFGGKHDKLAKQRLQRRQHSYVRYPAYKELIEPEEKTCASYLDPKRKEFWRTDVDTVLKREMKADKDRHNKLLEFIGNEEGFRKSELLRDREERWKAFMDYDSNVKWDPGFRNNQSGCKYDIITHQPTDEYEAKRVENERAKARYKLAKRGLYIQERMSGARPFDILSWRKMPPCQEMLEWPGDMEPPPGPRHDASKIQLNASKGACSFALPFGPFGYLPSGIR